MLDSVIKKQINAIHHYTVILLFYKDISVVIKKAFTAQ